MTASARRRVASTSLRVVASNSGGSSVAQTSTVCNLPANIVAGQELFVAFASDGNGTHTTPAGWTALASSIINTGMRQTMFRKTASGSEGASVTITHTNGYSAYVSGSIEGHSAAMEAGVAVGSSTGTSPNPPSLNPSWGTEKTLWLAACYKANGSITAQPSGYTVIDTGIATGAGGKLPRVQVAYLITTAVSEDPGAFTVSTSDWNIANTYGVYGPA